VDERRPRWYLLYVDSALGGHGGESMAQAGTAQRSRHGQETSEELTPVMAATSGWIQESRRRHSERNLHEAAAAMRQARAREHPWRRPAGCRACRGARGQEPLEECSARRSWPLRSSGWR